MAKGKKAPRKQKSESAKAIVRLDPNTLTLADKVEQVLIQGDLTPLTPAERVDYYKKVCLSLGLNPLTTPFLYILFREGEGSPAKLSLYATKSCTEQLRKIYGVSVIPPMRRSKSGDIITVEVDVRDRTGRTDTASGSVPTFRYKDRQRIDFTGKDLCNADMKCETKAKRRATLSICGLAFLDESELDTMQVIGGVTPEGRIYQYKNIKTDDPPQIGTSAAAQDVLKEKLKAAGVWCEKHQGPSSKCPSDEHSDGEHEAFAESEAKVKAQAKIVQQSEPQPAIPPTAEDPTVDIWPKNQVSSTAAMTEEDPAAMGRGDGVPKAEILPAVVLTLKCVIQAVTNKMTKGRPANSEGKCAIVSAPFLSVLAKMEDGDKWCNCFDRKLFEFITKGRGKEAEFVYKPANNPQFGPTITGIVRIGNTEFEDGQLPVISVHREPGTPDLFGAKP